MKKIILFVSYGITLSGLFLYSFTQIDLSLTFSRIEFLRNIVNSFQYIGYFNRPLSTFIFLFLVTAMTGLYITFLVLSFKKKLQKNDIWKLLIITTVILAFSYNAFSYDLFNYIFDAKIITHYHQNPYIHKALDYPGDPMLSFMHWTHRVYPYGPVWLMLTVPLSFIGFSIFIPTLFLFKAMIAASFLGSLYFLGKILQKVAPEKELPGLIFFGLNPLMLIENVVSAHLDIVMIFFCFWSFYLLIQKKHAASLILFAVSVGVKFATGFLLPVYIFVIINQLKKKTVNWNFVFLSSVIFMTAAVVAESMRSNFQPWYIVIAIAFAAFLTEKYYSYLPGIILSVSSLLVYAPFLYIGNWNKPIPEILSVMQTTSILLSIVAVLLYFVFNNTKKDSAFILNLKKYVKSGGSRFAKATYITVQVRKKPKHK